MKHLIIGGSGFIGLHTVKALKARGQEVWTYDLKDNRSFGGVMEARDYDVIHIYAARMGWNAPLRRLAANVDIIAEVFEQIDKRQKNLVRIVLASSQAVYTERCTQPFSEDAGYAPAPSFYGTTKQMQETACQQLCFSRQIQLAIMRYSVVVGPGQTPDGAYNGAVRSITGALLHERRPILFGNGDCVRDYVSVHDVAEANAMAGVCLLPQGVYNVGGPEHIKTVRLATMIHKLVGADESIGPYCCEELRKGDLVSSVSDSGKLKLFGWKHSTIGKSLAEYVLEQLAGKIDRLPDPGGDPEDAVNILYEKGLLQCP